MQIAVVHELPLEYYPPITNLIDYVSAFPDISLTVFSSHNVRNRPEYRTDNTFIWRPKRKLQKRNSLFRLLDRFTWHFSVARHMARLNPQAILYFEPHSSLAPYLYYKLLGGKSKLFIHHHEYYSKQDYLQTSNKSIRFFHRLESSYLYPRAEWISQTNEKRAELFSADHPKVDRRKIRVLPNLPPAEWKEQKNIAWSQVPPDGPLRLVYIGSLSLVDTYIAKLVQWVRQQSEREITLDIYAYQVDSATAKFLNDNTAKNLRFHSDGVAYHTIPDKLKDYHIGLILYKGNTVNFQHNATNKLFEYLACGLDVWFAEGLQGIEPYITKTTYPRVIPIDFNTLTVKNENPFTSRIDLPYQPWNGFCEQEFQTLLQVIKGLPQ